MKHHLITTPMESFPLCVVYTNWRHPSTNYPLLKRPIMLKYLPKCTYNPSSRWSISNPVHSFQDPRCRHHQPSCIFTSLFLWHSCSLQVCVNSRSAIPDHPDTYLLCISLRSASPDCSIRSRRRWWHRRYP